MRKITEFLSWVETFSFATVGEKKKILQNILNSIKNYKYRGEDTGEELYEYLKSNDAEFIGFVPHVGYFRIDDKYNVRQRNPLFVHPHGGPALMYKMKRFPAIIVTAGTLRFNDSYINDAKDNKKLNDVEGLTD